MRIQLSRKEIADAILNNDEITGTGGDRMGVFVWPNGRAEVRVEQRGTYYTGVAIYDPAAFVETDLGDDTTRWWTEAREERIKEGRIRDVFPDNLTREEEDLIDEYASLYDQVWREELRYRPVLRIDDPEGGSVEIEITWTD